MKIGATFYRWLAIGWTIIMLIGCLTPHNEVPDELLTLNDKFIHIALFVPFAGLWVFTGMRYPTVLVFGLLVGALIEGLQYALPINRSADWLDLLADCLGTAMGVGITWVWLRLFPKGVFKP